MVCYRLDPERQYFKREGGKGHTGSGKNRGESVKVAEVSGYTTGS